MRINNGRPTKFPCRHTAPGTNPRTRFAGLKRKGLGRQGTLDSEVHENSVSSSGSCFKTTSYTRELSHTLHRPEKSSGDRELSTLRCMRTLFRAPGHASKQHRTRASYRIRIRRSREGPPGPGEGITWEVRGIIRSQTGEGA